MPLFSGGLPKTVATAAEQEGTDMINLVKTAAVRALGIIPSTEKLDDWMRFSRWCRQSHLQCTFSSRSDNYRAECERMISRERLNSETIDFWEFGVYDGGWLRWWADHLSNPTNRFVGFDCFTGLPENWSETAPAGTFNLGGKPPQIDDSRVSFQVGLFQDTLPSFIASYRRRGKLIVRLDADLYSSTLQVLITVGHLLRPGDLLMFDEFVDPAHEFRAFSDFIRVFRFKYDVLCATPNLNQVTFRLS